MQNQSQPLNSIVEFEQVYYSLNKRNEHKFMLQSNVFTDKTDSLGFYEFDYEDQQFLTKGDYSESTTKMFFADKEAF